MSETTPHRISDRSGWMFTAIFVACLCILGTVLFIQHVKDMPPCPWCVVQRLGIMLIALIALVGALHRPGAMGARIYAGAGVIAGLSGSAVAFYHTLLELNPEQASACGGSPVERILDALGVGHMIPPLLQYDGPCTALPWNFAGLSVPNWSLMAFLLLTATFFFTPYVVEREK